jgi:hypothetical protein
MPLQISFLTRAPPPPLDPQKDQSLCPSKALKAEAKGVRTLHFDECFLLEVVMAVMIPFMMNALGISKNFKGAIQSWGVSSQKIDSPPQSENLVTMERARKLF